MGNHAALRGGVRQKLLPILLSPLSYFCVAFKNALLSNAQRMHRNTPALKPGTQRGKQRAAGPPAPTVPDTAGVVPQRPRHGPAGHSRLSCLAACYFPEIAGSKRDFFFLLRNHIKHCGSLHFLTDGRPLPQNTPQVES